MRCVSKFSTSFSNISGNDIGNTASNKNHDKFLAKLNQHIISSLIFIISKYTSKKY